MALRLGLSHLTAQLMLQWAIKVREKAKARASLGRGVPLHPKRRLQQQLRPLPQRVVVHLPQGGAIPS